MRFPVLYVDPPWPYQVYSKATGEKRSAASHYETATWPRISEMLEAMSSVAADPCALALWVVPPSMDTAIELTKAAGWRYVSKLFCWVKLNKKSPTPFTGMGFYTRANTEDCLLFTRASRKGRTVPRQHKGVPQVYLDLLDGPVETETVLHPRGRHSEKPELFAQRIEQLFPGPYIELFARKRRQGWLTLGNELDGLDITESIRYIREGQALPQLDFGARLFSHD